VLVLARRAQRPPAQEDQAVRAELDVAPRALLEALLEQGMVRTAQAASLRRLAFKKKR
jgi:hypothetical protein